MILKEFEKQTDNFANSAKTPVLFIGHGHPINAVLDNDFTRVLTELGRNIEKPNAVLVISAHWLTRGTFVSTNPKPKAIYDFGDFDRRLFEITYEPLGSPEFASEIAQDITRFEIFRDEKMGLDHGAWTILKYIFPNADVPVFQLSIDLTKPPKFHFQLGKMLKKLRNKGVLIIGSGNIVHNLREINWHDINAAPFEWTIEFDEMVKQKLNERNFEKLINYESFGEAAKLSIPTNEHYLPMIYALGLAEKTERIEYIFEGFQNSSISMRCFYVC